MLPQIPPHTWRGRSAAATALFVLWLVVGVPVAVAAGLVLLVLGVAVAVVALVVWLLWAGIAWVWFAIVLAERIPYPFRLLPPKTRRSRRLAGSSLYLQLAPRLVGGVARLAGVLFGPLLLATSIAGLFSARWRARPYLAVFTLPAVLRKVVNLGRRRGLLRDGHDADILRYDAFLSGAFPHILDFLDWWRDPQAPREYTPSPGLVDVPAGLLGLDLQPYPDPLGYPGLAAGALRRHSIRSLREVFLSQREIDDLCDPDLDDRADVGLIRVASRVDAHGLRHWIVQFPSTKSWHPRAGAAPNDLTADLVIGAEQEPTATRAAIATMLHAGIRPGEPVLLAGFSLGGMVAAQVADRATRAGLTVAHLVVAGTPLGRVHIPDGVRVLAIEHVLDIVPRIDGRENPVRPPLSAQGTDRFVTVKAGPLLPVGFRLGALHQSTAYADTAKAIEEQSPDALVASMLDELAVYFGQGQTVVDHAMLRTGGLGPQPSVPFYLHSTVQEGITRGTLRQTLRRIPGVIAVDVYQSRAGFATTILWNADVLVRSLKPWFTTVERFAVYRGLLSLLKRRRAVGIHFRLQAKETPGVTWEATVQQMADGQWREILDVSFDDSAAEAEFEDAFPGGAAPTVVFYPPSAFDPVVDTASRR
ncbi:thioesterase domain-containing protein [Leifsonia sp. NCR5]|uniref:thioesterase domain-containing protein n=1 Tax=Leifsonia sp. NCR5 TaxID=1978342 RepID=UPI000A18B311|nr:thioesterase domain-containing protein [Leifsonia sp. NCR5]